MSTEFLPREAFADEQSYITYKQHMALLKGMERVNAKRLKRVQRKPHWAQWCCDGRHADMDDSQGAGKAEEVLQFAAMHTKLTGHETEVEVMYKVIFSLENDVPKGHDTHEQSA